jgi:hypothetical protein
VEAPAVHDGPQEREEQQPRVAFDERPVLVAVLLAHERGEALDEAGHVELPAGGEPSPQAG